MGNIHIQRTVAASPSEVYAVLNNVGEIHRFHPVVESSRRTEGSAPGGVGATRICTFYDGNSVEEKVTEATADRSLAITVTKGSMPMNRVDARFELTPTKDGGTVVHMFMDYEMKMGPLGAAMDALIVRRKFTGTLKLLLAGLEHHLDTGEEVGADFKSSAA